MESTDPYATAKANLRDTVKWLATTLAGLNALVLAGAPFSGFGSLEPGSPRFYAAIVALAGASVLLLQVWSSLLFLLRSDTVSPSQLRKAYRAGTDKVEAAEIEALRQHLDARKTDLLPTGIADFDALEAYAAELWIAASAPGAAAADLERWNGYNSNIALYLNYATFQRLHRRISTATSRILWLASSALVLLVAFAWASNPPKQGASERVTVLQPLALPGGMSAPALSPVVFASGKAEVDAAGLAAITAAGDWLRAHPDTGVLLNAHPEGLGSATVDRDLAEKRAAAVRTILMQQPGVPSSRVFVAEAPKPETPSVSAPRDHRTVDFQVVVVPKRP